MTAVAKRVEAVEFPSEQIIPAVRGECYSYSSSFSSERPLYFFLKCKSNKSRPLVSDVEQLLQELDLTFIFGQDVLLCSPDSAPSISLLTSVLNEAELRRLKTTEIRKSTLSAERFQGCLEARSGLVLVDAFHSSGECASVVPLVEGLTLSVRTAANKYGLIRASSVTASSCALEACHILL